MLVRTRNHIAGVVAIIGGFLIFLGGGTGMVALLVELQNIIEGLLGGSNETVETIFWILIFIATLGGIAVMIGGVLFYKSLVVSGRFVIALGAGIGIFGLIIALLMSLYRGESSEFISWLTTSFLGLGIILALISRYIAKRPGII